MRDHGDRRHGRRHRVAAVPGGHPAVPRRRRAAPVHVHPPHARALHRPRRGAEDQADAALGQRAAAHRHPARHGGVPVRGRPEPRHPQEDRAVRLAAGGRGGLRARRRPDLQGAARSSARRASTTSCSSTSGSRRPPPDLGRLGGARASAPARRSSARPCGSRSSASTSSSRTPTCRSSRRCATRASSTAAGSRSTGWTRRRSTTRRSRRARRGGRRHPHPGRLRRARDRGQDRRLADRPRAADPVPRRLPRHADGRGRLRAPRRRTWPGANSTEFDPETPYPVIDLLPEQKEVADMGGTMRLGADPVKLHAGHAGARDLRRGGDLRAPPPPLRGQQLPPPPPRGGRARGLGHVARRAPGRDHRDPGPPVLRRVAVPPRVQVAARAARRRCSATSWAPPSPTRRGASRTRSRAGEPCASAPRGRRAPAERPRADGPVRATGW